MEKSEFQGGKVVSFRLPHNVPQIVSEHLEHLRKTHGRKFSSEIADRFVQAIEKEALFGRPDKQLVIPFPKNLTEEEKVFLQSDRSKALIGQLIVQLLSNPSEVTVHTVDPDSKLGYENTENGRKPSEDLFITNEAVKGFVNQNFLNFDDDD